MGELSQIFRQVLSMDLISCICLRLCSICCVASLEVLLFMMATADRIFFWITASLVWERIFYATFLLRIFCFAKRSTILILKSILGSITELLTHAPLGTIWWVFSNKNSKLEVYFRNLFYWDFSQISIWTLFNQLLTRMFNIVEWIAWSVSIHEHHVFLTSLWVWNSYFDSFYQKWEKSTSIDWKLNTKIKRNREMGSWILLRKLTKWLPNNFFCG